MKDITLTEKDLITIFNEHTYYYVRDMTMIRRYAEGEGLNQNNNIREIEKFHDDKEFREHLEETNKSRVELKHYKRIENYYDFLGFKHKMINHYNSIKVKDEDKHEVFIRAEKQYETENVYAEIPELRTIDIYVSCTWINRNDIKYHDTLHMHIINGRHVRVGR